MKTLEGLQTLCIGDGNLQLGVIKACVDFLGLDVSAGWLAGATGNAFIMSISGGVDICDTYFAYASDEGVPGVGPDVVMRLDVSDLLADQVGAFITTAPTAWPPESGEVRLADLPVSFGANITFLGYTLRDSTIRPTDWVELTTYWRLDGPPPDDLTLFAHLLGSPVVVIPATAISPPYIRAS